MLILVGASLYKRKFQHIGWILACRSVSPVDHVVMQQSVIPGVKITKQPVLIKLYTYTAYPVGVHSPVVILLLSALAEAKRPHWTP